MKHAHTWIGWGIITATLAACDTLAPTPPILDPLPTSTSQATVTLQGVAEPKTTVRVARTPDFTEDMSSPLSSVTMADPTNGTFWMRVPLTLGDGALSTANVFRVTSQDAAGNTSPETTITVVREARRPEALAAVLDPARVDADSGSMLVRITSYQREDAVPHAGLQVTVGVVQAGVTIMPVTGVTDASGAAVIPLAGLTKAGSGTIHIEAVQAGPEGKAMLDLPFEVAAGQPHMVTLALAPSPATAGETVTATTVVTDQNGNTVALPVELGTDAPGAFLAGMTLSHLTKASGSTPYKVTARVAGSGVVAQADLTVNPAAAATLVTHAAPVPSLAGETVSITAHVEDAFGNVRTLDTPTLAAALGVDNQGAPQALAASQTSNGTVASQVAIKKAGTYAVQASAGTLMVDIPLTVLPAGPASLAVTLTPSPVEAGTPVDVSAIVADAFGNAVTSLVEVSSDAPGAFVSGTTILGLTHASATPFHVSTAVVGTSLVEDVELTVLAGPPAALVGTASPTQARAGGEVTFQANAQDAFGNVCLTLSPTLAGAFPVDNQGMAQVLGPVGVANGVATAQATFNKAGTYAVDAAVGTLAGQLHVQVDPGSPSLVTVVPTPSPLVAGGALAVEVTVADSLGNTIPLPVDLWTDAPNALVTGTTIQRITRATGAAPYTVHAKVRDLALEGTASLVVVPATPATLRFTASPAVAPAGSTVALHAHVEDAFGNSITTPSPLISGALGADNLNNTQEIAPYMVLAGMADTSTVLRRAGTYTLDAAALGLAARVHVEIQPAAPDVNGFTFTLDTPPPGGFLASNPVGFTYQVLDSFRNETHLPVVVTANAPNVFVVDNGDGSGSLNGIVRAGSYTVRALVPGSGLVPQTEPLVVAPNPGEGFNLTLSAALASQGGTVLAFLNDGFGNSLPPSSVVFTVSASVAITGNQLTFSLPGTYAVKACLVALPTLCDTEYVGVQGVVDVTPPSVAVAISFPQSPQVDVPVGGRVSFTITASDDRGLSEVSYVAQYGTGGSCLSKGGPVLIPSGTLTTTPPVAFTFTVPGCALPLDRISIVARAGDLAGNVQNSAENATLRVSTQFTNMAASAGFVVQTLAVGGRLNVCQDAALEAGTGRVLVSNAGSDRGAAIYADRTVADLQDSNGQRINLSVVPKGVEFDAVGRRTFFALEQPDAIAAVTVNGLFNPNFIQNTGNGGPMVQFIPVGLSLDNGVLCAAFPSNRSFQCFNNLDTTPASIINRRDTVNMVEPRWIAIRGSDIWVSDRAARKLHHYSTVGGGTFVGSITPSPAMLEPMDILVAPVTGNLLVVDRNGGNNGKLVRVNPNTGAATTVVSGFDAPVGLAWDGNGILVTDEGNNISEAVFLVTPDPANPGVF